MCTRNKTNCVYYKRLDFWTANSEAVIMVYYLISGFWRGPCWDLTNLFVGLS